MNIVKLLFLSTLLLTFCGAFSQTDEELGLHSEGGAWSFFPAKEKNDSLKKVLLIGDSVMNGFHQSVIDSLKKCASVDYWLTPKHLKSEYLLEDLAAVVSSNKYDVIQFNIGLHGWPKGRILDHEYLPLLEKYVNTLIENANGANLIWASITPVTEEGNPVLNQEINPRIAKRNEWAAAVMKKYNIPINDLYSLVENKLDLAKLDRWHWKPEGYVLMADQSVKCIVQELY
ncbi:SGNH/GDSL hydrolase family protein [uncultured Draconibacterium sp.]|uniref:SGNH/GDSL hydrolase family protein n=1 Tax=uncultured Draconibacterium sp. TaxID=1573823 RepID=UPI003260CE45